MALNTPKRIKTLSNYANSPSNSECCVLSSWKWVDNATSPSASSCGSPEFIARSNNHQNSNVGQENKEKCENRRGRPRSESLTTLMIEGSTSPSSIKCSYCNRVFPREKSLAAHLRTHTGERPYTCDYPGCTRAFTQSGQLKTHQRLHTGERPFICSALNCQMRFTHANRHCPDHPYDQLKRCDDFVVTAIPEQNTDVLKWLEKYRSEREDRTPTRKTPQRANKPLKDNNENVSLNLQNNENECPLTPNANHNYKSRKGLMVELDMNAGLGTSPIAAKNKPHPKLIQWQEPLSQEEDSGDECETPPRSSFYPKKKWLREACLDDLAKPLETTVQQQSNQQSSSINPNQTRPTVLMIASKDKTMPLPNAVIPGMIPKQNAIARTIRPEENRKWLGALALMQLATDDAAEEELTTLELETVHVSPSTMTSVIQSYTQL